MSEEFVKLEEVWSDSKGNILVLLVNGDYELYINPKTIYMQQQGMFGNGQKVILSDTDFVRDRSVRVRTKFLNFLRGRR